MVVGIDRTSGNDVRQDKEIRRLRRDLARRGAGGGGAGSGGAIQGPVSTANGGSGIVGSPLGVSMWKNASGGTRSQGYVVVSVPGTDQSFDDSTTVGDGAVLGVLDDNSVVVGVAGRVRHIGYQNVVNVQGNVTAGDFIYQSSTAGRAASAGTVAHPGVFGQALTTYSGGGAGTVAAYLFPPVRIDEIGISLSLDGGGSALTTGVKGWFEVPFDFTVTGWTLTGDVSGSLVLDLWKDVYASYPPTIADTVTGSEKPTISSAFTGQDLSLSTWIVTWSKGDWVYVNVDSCTSITRATLGLRGVKR